MPVFRLGEKPDFPPASLAEPEGLLAVGGDLSPERLLAAYTRGIFPWYSAGEPILWWSPDPRTVLLPENFHIPKRLLRTLRQKPFDIRINTSFTKVMRSCAQAPRKKRNGTWITEEMILAYTALHERGIAVSYEAWLDGDLVGGVYGLQIGKAFFAESKFYVARDASKILLATLCQRLFEEGFLFVDAQMYNDHLGQFGFAEIPRSDYLEMLQQAVG